MNKAIDRLLNGLVYPNDGCWYWTRKGRIVEYTTFYCQGKTYSPYRLAYELFIGPIPDGYHVHHICRRPPCCNPDHLEALSPREHLLQSNNPATRNMLATHCCHGHEFTEENIYRPPGSPNTRLCRQCRASGPKARERAKKWKQANRERANENRRRWRASRRAQGLPVT